MSRNPRNSECPKILGGSLRFFETGVFLLSQLCEVTLASIARERDGGVNFVASDEL